MKRDDVSSNLLLKRDLINFTRIRAAHPGDDLFLGDLLVRSFTETYSKKLPDTVTTEAREKELRDVHSRRAAGVVRVIELGFQIIGTHSLVAPGSELDQSWTPNTATLRCVALDPRFQSLKLSEYLLNDALEIAKKWRAERICLHVQKGAHGINRLYETFGFKRSPEGDRLDYGNEIEGYLFQVPRELERAEFIEQLGS